MEKLEALLKGIYDTCDSINTLLPKVDGDRVIGVGPLLCVYNGLHQIKVGAVIAETDVADLRRQLAEAHETCASLDKQLTAAHRAAKVLMEALEFYARMDHVEYLSGKREWEADRKSLAKRGFRFVHEDIDGQETFVEYGEKAEEAIATAKQITEGGE